MEKTGRGEKMKKSTKCHQIFCFVPVFDIHGNFPGRRGRKDDSPFTLIDVYHFPSVYSLEQLFNDKKLLVCGVDP
ncbi:hypothetical protein ACH3XW_38680 [Acanthocheilonema viteae]